MRWFTSVLLFTMLLCIAMTGCGRRTGSSPNTCAAACVPGSCGADGCGGTCTCAADQSCEATTQTCKPLEPCIPESDTAACARWKAECGTATRLDNCGQVRKVANCGRCDAALHCNPRTNQCVDCVPLADNVICERRGKNCGPLTDSDGCGLQVTVDCGSCTAPETCGANGICSESVSNDTCDRAEPLIFEGGVATTAGDTTAASADLEGTCGGDGRDVVYSFSVPTLSTLTATLVPAQGSALAPVLYVRHGCAMPVEIPGACVTASPGATTRLVVPLISGDWFLIVDSSGAGAGPFTLRVELSQPGPKPENDDCSNASPMPLGPTHSGPSRFGLAEGSTTWAANDASGTCGRFDGPDVVYRLHVASRSKVSLRVVAGSDDTFSPAIYLRRTCASVQPADEVACAPPTGAETWLWLETLPAGDYFIFVDGVAGSFGEFVLEVGIGPINDACADAEPLNLTGGQAWTAGSLDDATDDYQGSCGGAGGPELFYALTLPGPGLLRARISGFYGPDPAIYPPTLSLMSRCGSSASAAGEIACVSGTAAPLRASLTAPKVFLAVDGSTGAGFGFELELLYGSAPANDTCAGATRLQFDATGAAHAAGDTSLAADDFISPCGAPAGGDVVYEFALAQDAAVAAVVTATRWGARPGQLKPVVYLRRAGCAAGGDICGVGAGDTVALISSVPLNAGTWELVVDDSDAFGGPFDLNVMTFAPVGGNGCTQPIRLVPDPSTGIATHVFDTALGSNLNGGSCGGAGSPEVAYLVVLDAWTDLDVTVQPQEGGALRPVLYARRDCAVPASERTASCDGAAAVGLAAHLALTLNAGFHYLFVDGGSGSRGAYTLTAIARASTGHPANETCATAQSLVLDPQTGSATVAGDLSTAANDYGVCGGTGNDVLYSFTLAAERAMTVEVSTPGDRVNAALLRSCPPNAGSAVIGCADADRWSRDPLRTGPLAAGTYWVAVEAAYPTSSTFELKLTADSPPANDRCANAADLVFDATGAVTVTGDTTAASNDAIDSTGAGANNGDVVYRVVVTQDAYLQADLTGAGTKGPVLFLRGACADKATEIARASANSPSHAVLQRMSLTAGTYYLWVDGETNNTARGAPYSLYATLRVASLAPANDRCPGAPSLEFDANGHATATGTTLNATNDFSWYPGCPWPLRGPDVVYAFTLDSAASVTATVTRDSISPGYSPAVMILAACPPTTAFDVRTDTSGFWGAPVTAARLEAGQYWVAVDAVDAAYGGFALDLARGTPLSIPDNCALAAPLTFDANGLVTAAGTLNGADYSATSSLATATGGPDVVYTFTLGAAADIYAEAAFGASTYSMSRSVYLTRGCGTLAPGAELSAGTDSSTPRLTARNVPAGTYFLWIDSDGSSSGAFVLTVLRTQPQEAGDCNQPRPLVLTGGVAVASGSTLLARAANRGWCAHSVYSPGGEQVFAMTLAMESAIDLQVARAGGESRYIPVLQIRSNCADPRTELRCSGGWGGSSTSISLDRLAAGTYYVIVGSDGYEGRFELHATASATRTSPPVNDTCASAYSANLTAQNPSAAFVGTLMNAGDDNSPSCAISAGPDVAYKIVTTAPAELTAEAVAYLGFSPVISIRSACGGSAGAGSEVACARSGSGAATITAQVTAGTWYVWVDADGAGAAPFELHVNANYAAAPPLNDSCAHPEPIRFLNGTAVVSGVGPGALSDTGASCTEGRRALVYSFSVGAQSSLTAVTDEMPYSGALFVRRGACADRTANAEVICAPTGSSSPSASGDVGRVFLPRVEAGDWFLWADGFGGQLRMTVALDAPKPSPANDLCASAAPVARGQIVVGDTTDADDDYGGAGLSRRCDRGGLGLFLRGRDLVYRYSPTSTGPFSVTYEPLGFKGAVWLAAANACGEDAQCIAYAKADLYPNAPVALQVQGEAGSDYFVIVDGMTRADYGAFTLEVE